MTLHLSRQSLSQLRQQVIFCFLIFAAVAKVRMAEADVDQARLLPNPVLTIIVRFRKEPSSPIITPSISEDLLAILQRGRRVSAADKRLRAATAGALDVVLKSIADVE